MRKFTVISDLYPDGLMSVVPLPTPVRSSTFYRTGLRLQLERLGLVGFAEHLYCTKSVSGINCYESNCYFISIDV